MNAVLNEQSLIYLQIAHILEKDILKGVYAEEEQVPSTNELARMFKINPATAAKGLNLLVDKNILYKKRGIGMFVVQGAVENIRNSRKEVFYKEFIKTMVVEAKNLGITSQELLDMIAKAEQE